MARVTSFRIVNGRLQEKLPTDVDCPVQNCQDGQVTTVHGHRAQCHCCGGSGKVRSKS